MANSIAKEELLKISVRLVDLSDNLTVSSDYQLSIIERTISAYT